mmetsp:Transcript_13466/g.36271  ORF Transcript_13466/g.36271 Transcript_13466/m.36271 type:complete len:240 (+) Transcript_13466:3958-4677(+)
MQALIVVATSDMHMSPAADLVLPNGVVCWLPDNEKSPEKAFTVWTLLGSLRSRLARSCPAATIAPEFKAWCILPDAVVRKDMIIFMASNSTNGSPSATSAPSAWRYRTTFPLKSERSSDGSRSFGNVIVALPSMRRRRPSASSTPDTCVTVSPVLMYKEPSGCSRMRASRTSSPMLNAKRFSATRVTRKTYLVESYATSTTKDWRSRKSLCNGKCPRFNLSRTADVCSATCVCARKHAA